MLNTSGVSEGVISFNLNEKFSQCSTYCYLSESPDDIRIISEVELEKGALKVTASDDSLNGETFTWAFVCDSLESRTVVTDSFEITFSYQYQAEYDDLTVIDFPKRN